MHESRESSSLYSSEDVELGVKNTILLVEDEIIIALMERRILERADYRVLSVGTGEEAVQTGLFDPTIDLILMDIDLGSGLSGLEAAERILAGRKVPIVFLSADTSESRRKKAEDISPAGLISKGLPTKKFLAYIRSCIPRGHEEENPRAAP